MWLYLFQASTKFATSCTSMVLTEYSRLLFPTGLQFRERLTRLMQTRSCADFLGSLQGFFSVPLRRCEWQVLASPLRLTIPPATSEAGNTALLPQDIEPMYHLPARKGLNQTHGGQTWCPFEMSRPARANAAVGATCFRCFGGCDG